MKANEYRELSIEDLTSRAEELRRSIFNLRTRALTKELKDVSRIGAEKRELARVLTVIGEKQGIAQG